MTSPQVSDLIELAKYETDPQKRLRLITAARTLALIAAGADPEQPPREAPSRRAIG